MGYLINRSIYGCIGSGPQGIFLLSVSIKWRRAIVAHVTGNVLSVWSVLHAVHVSAQLEIAFIKVKGVSGRKSRGRKTIVHFPLAEGVYERLSTGTMRGVDANGAVVLGCFAVAIVIVEIQQPQTARDVSAVTTDLIAEPRVLV